MPLSFFNTLATRTSPHIYKRDIKNTILILTWMKKFLEVNRIFSIALLPIFTDWPRIGPSVFLSLLTHFFTTLNAKREKLYSSSFAAILFCAQKAQAHLRYAQCAMSNPPCLIYKTFFRCKGWLAFVGGI